MKNTGLALLIAIAGLLSGCSMLQDHLLYFPAKAGISEMAVAGLRPWPTAQDFRGLVAEPGGEALGTAIVFHGNAGHAGHRRFYAAALNRLGWRVILAEYPGYGPRSGPLGEKSLVGDAAASIALARREYGAPLLVVGESLGAAVAAQAAARKDLSDGLLLITPWDRLEHVAAHHYPWLPAKWLLRDPYDSSSALAAYARPVLVAVAEQDEIVPARFGRALHAALAADKHLRTIGGAGHNDWPARVDEAWWREAIAFLIGRAGRK